VVVEADMVLVEDAVEGVDVVEDVMVKIKYVC